MSFILNVIDLILISVTIGLFIASIFWTGVLLHHIAGLLTVANIIIIKFKLGYIEHRIENRYVYSAIVDDDNQNGES